MIDRIQVVDDGVHDGIVNMRRDTYLLDLDGVRARVYQWDRDWVSLGMFQTPETALVDGCHTPWVMRPTGGKAVLHGHDLTLGMSAPLALIGTDSRGVKTAYRWLAEPIISALNEVGIPATLAERTPFVRGAGKVADCFAHVAANDIVHPGTGQKVCGCALRLTHDAVLLQASIPLGRPLADPAEVFDIPALVSMDRSVTRIDFAAALRESLAAWVAQQGDRTILA
ncbi:MAG: hypothetical protein LCH41_13415 [Armatimonadetes bacterium]|nr:hypothetical protein [Armatimonadota bacterium]